PPSLEGSGSCSSSRRSPRPPPLPFPLTFSRSRGNAMSNHPFSMLERAAQDTQGWLHEISREMNHPSLKVAYHALRGVLGALRDRLPIEEVHHLAAQLPVLVRGLYFEGYDPTGKPEKLDREAFLARVAAALSDVGGTNPETAARAVLRVLD